MWINESHINNKWSFYSKQEPFVEEKSQSKSDESNQSYSTEYNEKTAVYPTTVIRIQSVCYFETTQLFCWS